MTKSLTESLNGLSPISWALDLLDGLGAPHSNSNLQVLYSWMYQESGGGGGMWNPLNTTQQWTNTTDYNSSGVKNYASYQDGQAATVRVLHDNAYSQIVLEFHKGDSSNGLIAAITSSIWGTKSLSLKPLPVFNNNLGVEMQIVPSPNPPTLKGRTAAALWNPAKPTELRLENGARMIGDVPYPNVPGVFLWKIPILPGFNCVGIAPSISTAGSNRGRPDGLSVVCFDDHQNTYNALWQYA